MEKATASSGGGETKTGIKLQANTQSHTEIFATWLQLSNPLSFTTVLERWTLGILRISKSVAIQTHEASQVIGIAHAIDWNWRPTTLSTVYCDAATASSRSDITKEVDIKFALDKQDALTDPQEGQAGEKEEGEEEGKDMGIKSLLQGPHFAEPAQAQASALTSTSTAVISLDADTRKKAQQQQLAIKDKGKDSTASATTMTTTGTQDEASKDKDLLVDTDLRYLGYAGRLARVFGQVSRRAPRIFRGLRTGLKGFRLSRGMIRMPKFLAGSTKKAQKVLLYTSDLGESSRPLISHHTVEALHFVTFAYIVGDVTYNAYHEYKQGGNTNEIAKVATRTFVFQTLASIVLPGAAIHHAMEFTERRIQTMTMNARAHRFAPVIIGLSLIPVLPLIDHPLERAIEKVFDWVWPSRGGGTSHSHGSQGSQQLKEKHA